MVGAIISIRGSCIRKYSLPSGALRQGAIRRAAASGCRQYGWLGNPFHQGQLRQQYNQWPRPGAGSLSQAASAAEFCQAVVRGLTGRGSSISGLVSHLGSTEPGCNSSRNLVRQLGSFMQLSAATLSQQASWMHQGAGQASGPCSALALPLRVGASPLA